MREDHEKLKIDSVERLTCCYAHSEETPTFHRRIYWLISSPTNATGTGEGVGATGVATPDIFPADCHAVRGAEGVEKTGGVAKLPPKRNVSKCDEESATGGDGAENSSCSRYSVYLLYWYKSANTEAAAAVLCLCIIWMSVTSSVKATLLSLPGEQENSTLTAP